MFLSCFGFTFLVSFLCILKTPKLQVTELKPEWLIELAPHYYQLKDVEDGKNLFIIFLYCYL